MRKVKNETLPLHNTARIRELIFSLFPEVTTVRRQFIHMRKDRPTLCAESARGSGGPVWVFGVYTYLNEGYYCSGVNNGYLHAGSGGPYYHTPTQAIRAYRAKLDVASTPAAEKKTLDSRPEV